MPATCTSSPATIRNFLFGAGLFLLVCSGSVFSQSNGHQSEDQEEYTDAYYDSLLASYLEYDSLLLSEMQSDSVSLLDLIDSLLSADFSLNMLSLRTGYTSSILNAGRDYGIKQYGFTGGLSYYHSSGLYFDMISYWNSDIDPKFYLTTLSAGYMGVISKKWSYILSYDHFNYNKSDESNPVEYPFNNSLNISSYYNIKFISAGVDYSFLFGNESAHRIRPNISGVIRTKKVGFIDRITMMPGIYVLLGNADILNISTNYQTLRQLIRKIGWRRFLRLYKNKPDQIESLIYQTTEDNVFGLMNYTLGFPVYMYIGKFTVMASYSINFPVALPGENIDLTPNSYFGATLIYNFYFK